MGLIEAMVEKSAFYQLNGPVSLDVLHQNRIVHRGRQNRQLVKVRRKGCIDKHRSSDDFFKKYNSSDYMENSNKFT